MNQRVFIKGLEKMGMVEVAFDKVSPLPCTKFNTQFEESRYGDEDDPLLVIDRRITNTGSLLILNPLERIPTENTIMDMCAKDNPDVVALMGELKQG